MTKCLKPYSCKLEKQQCSRRSATYWAQRVDTQVDWPKGFWEMTKCLKPYSCKLKKQQCSRRSATCWAQRIDTQVDWPNSFWDMTKCLKPYSCKLEKQQCSRRSATCWAQRVDTQVDCPIVSEISQNVWNLILANWRNNSVVGAALPAEHNALTLRSIGPRVSKIWQNVWNLILVNWRNNSVVGVALPTEQNALPKSFWDLTKCLKPYSRKLKKQQCSRRSATCWAQRVDTQVDWPKSFWDMRKCLKPYSCKLKKQQCSRRSAAEHNGLTLRSIGPIVSEIWQNVWNLILANWRNNSVVGAALPAEHNALTLRSIAQ